MPISNLKWIVCFCLFIGCLFSCNSDSSNKTIDPNSFNKVVQNRLKEAEVFEESLEFDEAINIFQRLCIDPDFSSASDSLRSNVYHKYGLMFFNKNNYQQAILYLDTAIIIRSNIKDYQALLANSYYIRGQAKIHVKDEKALSDIQQAIEYIEPIGDSETIARYYIFMAVALQDRGDFGRAEQYYQKVLNETSIEEGSHRMGMLYLNLGTFYALQKEHQEEQRVLQKALSIFKKRGKLSERNYFATLVTIGNSFLRQGEWLKAETYFTKLLDKISQSQKSYFGLQETCLNSLAFANVKMQNWEKARTFYLDLLDLSARLSNSPYNIRKAYAYEGLGDVDLGKSKFTASITNYHKSLQSLFLDFNTDDIYATPSIDKNPYLNKKDAMRILELKADAHLAKFDDSHQQVDLKEALEIFQCIDDLLTNIRQGFKASSSRFGIVKSSIPVYEKASLIALQLHELSQDKKYLHQAFHFATKNKAVVLQDGLQDEQAKFGAIPAKLLNQENALKKEYYQVETEIIAMESAGKKTKLLSDKKNKRFEIIRAYEKLIQKLEQEYPKYYQLKYEVNQVVDPDVIAESLPEESALIEFFVSKKQLFVFTISSKGLKHYVLPKPRKLFTKSRKFRAMLQNSDDPSISQEYMDVAYSLYQSLLEAPLADLEKEQVIKRLIIIPDNQLLQVSFDALLYQSMEEGAEPITWGNSEIPYLLRRYAISYAYSNQLIADPVSNKRIKKSLNSFVGFGLEYDDYTLKGINELSKLEVDTTLSRGMGKLYHSVKEVEEVKEIVGGGKLYRNTNATKGSFLKYAPASKILHLAMHGYESAVNPLNSALVFTRKKGKTDFLLKASDLYTMSLNADMTVLSACHTASGRVYEGEGVRSLARAFRYAGSPSLVATLWSVSDYSTKEIIVEFYKHLKNGDSKDVALQKAKLNYIRTKQPSQKMPYFWTNLVLIGETAPLDF